jgi:hypothetical protein
MKTTSQVFESLLESNAPRSVISSAHLHLAQLSDEPHGSLGHYQSAVDILYSQFNEQKQSNGIEGGSGDQQLRQDIAKALVAMTEIWLTDLW